MACEEVFELTPPTPTPEQVADNISEAKRNGYHLICGGRYTWLLEREWDSIISIVPEEYAEARALNNVDMEAQVEEAMLDEAQAQAEGMQECYDL